MNKIVANLRFSITGAEKDLETLEQWAAKTAATVKEAFNYGHNRIRY